MSIHQGIELNVVSSRWICGHTLEIEFSDGVSRRIDFEPFLKGAVHPDIQKYLDSDLFKAVEIQHGNLVWNDYDLCFPIEDLYSGHISVGQQSQQMVAEERPAYGVNNKRDNEF